ncbi:CopG family ribbon-helix-helix protein [Litoribacillus peritrichatus]|uniref:CopG family ribbon-helix-helix protein n=1 Tax=Litoribacillus peritrichatus TaxID=718191 RepID=A0ABP7N1J3_9GAMM
MGVTSVRLNSEVEGPLENLANKLDRSKNYLINQAIKEFVQRQSMKDARWEDTLEALSSIKAGKTVDGNEVTAWLESWGTEEELSPPKV